LETLVCLPLAREALVGLQFESCHEPKNTASRIAHAAERDRWLRAADTPVYAHAQSHLRIVAEQKFQGVLGFVDLLTVEGCIRVAATAMTVGDLFAVESN
jgi:hypothetical protein